MRYLTVQDIIWINTVVAKNPQPFDYSRLEEASFFQYLPGRNADEVEQAARFLEGFIRLSPFTACNDATALVGCAVFLLMNGKQLELPPKFGSKVDLGSITVETLRKWVTQLSGHAPGTAEQAVPAVFERHSETIAKLAADCRQPQPA